MKILGVDPGSKMGWSLIEGSSYCRGGTTEVRYPTASQQKKGKPKGLKWSGIQDAVSHMLSDCSPDTVVVESVRRHSGVAAAHCYGFIRYTLEAECARRGIPFYTLEVQEWKKLSTGKGNADKDAVAESMIDLYGDIEFDTDDHSDSLGIAHAWLVASNEEVDERETGLRGDNPQSQG